MTNMTNSKLLHAGIALMGAGAAGIIFAAVMEIQTGEPIYLLVMKITAGLFGIGGPLFGLAIARKSKRK
ncbi:hypothetical protein ES703_30692 [subsurface metagenome]